MQSYQNNHTSRECWREKITRRSYYHDRGIDICNWKLLLALSTMKLPSSSFIFSSSLILLSYLLLLGKSTARVPLQLIEFMSLIDEDVAVLISGAFSFNLIICRRLGGSSFNKCSFSRLIYNSEALKQLSLAVRGADVNKQSNFNTKNHAVAWLVTNNPTVFDTENDSFISL